MDWDDRLNTSLMIELLQNQKQKNNFFFPPWNSALFYNLPFIQDTYLRQTPKVVFGAEMFKYSNAELWYRCCPSLFSLEQNLEEVTCIT